MQDVPEILVGEYQKSNAGSKKTEELRVKKKPSAAAARRSPAGDDFNTTFENANGKEERVRLVLKPQSGRTPILVLLSKVKGESKETSLCQLVLRKESDTHRKKVYDLMSKVGQLYVDKKGKLEKQDLVQHRSLQLLMCGIDTH